MLDVRRRFRKKNYELLRAIYTFWHSDIIIVSFPKSGRTWLRVLMGKALKEHLNCTNDLLPTLEAIVTASCPSIPNFLVYHGAATTQARSDGFDVSNVKYKDKKLFCWPETLRMLLSQPTSTKADVKKRRLTPLSQISCATTWAASKLIWRSSTVGLMPRKFLTA